MDDLYEALRDFTIETPEWHYACKKGVRLKIDPYHGASIISYHVRVGDLKLVQWRA
jgi:hypothetical protein